MTPTPPPPYRIGIELTKAETIWIAKNQNEAASLGYPESYILRCARQIPKLDPTPPPPPKPRKPSKPYTGQTDGTIFADRPAYETFWLPELYEVYLRRIAPVCTAKQAAELMKNRGYLNRHNKPYQKNYLWAWARKTGVQFKTVPARPEKVDKRNERYKTIVDSLPPGLTSGQAKRYFSEAGIIITQSGVINICQRHGYELKRIYIRVADGE